jgi:hypothetical protein
MQINGLSIGKMLITWVYNLLRNRTLELIVIEDLEGNSRFIFIFNTAVVCRVVKFSICS